MFAIVASSCERGHRSATIPPPHPSTTATTTTTATTATTTTTGHPEGEHLIAAGDITDCKTTDDEKTAGLLAKLPGTIATLGDTVYETGSKAEFATCFDPSWGRYKDRIRPAPGNHDYSNGRADAYFAYFGDAAGPGGSGYYSYDLGSWHIIALNSNCAQISCKAASPQQQWLAKDLAEHPAKCTLAYWHHPRFSSGLHGPTKALAPLYQTLYDNDVDVVLAGHDHDYERFVPLNPAGQPDSARGIRNFVVGTGGRLLYPAIKRDRRTQVINDATFGVLDLTLGTDAYSWRFVPTSGNFSDSGSGPCH